MVVIEKLEILETILGQATKANKNYYQFTCPFCNHYKPKLGIDLNTGKWKCWICPSKGFTIGALFFKLNVTPTLSNKAKELWKDVAYNKATQPISTVTLPSEYQPLTSVRADNFMYKRALKYAMSRNITSKDIIKHRIGYADSGRYNGYLIFPNYDENNILNYYTSRAFEPFKQLNHLLPDIDKNIIGDEWLINWEEDLILCESKLDAITIRRNAVPLFGKTLNVKLKEKIASSSLSKIYMCLDGDANNDIIENAKYFMNNGKQVFHCNLSNGDDPNSLGFEKVWNYINNAKVINAEDTFKNDIFKKLKM